MPHEPTSTTNFHFIITGERKSTGTITFVAYQYLSRPPVLKCRYFIACTKQCPRRRVNISCVWSSTRSMHFPEKPSLLNHSLTLRKTRKARVRQVREKVRAKGWMISRGWLNINNSGNGSFDYHAGTSSSKNCRYFISEWALECPVKKHNF